MASHTVKELLGQPVITLNSGRRVGSIQEILYDPGANAVTAIILSKPPVAGGAKAVAAGHVVLFGADVTLVDDESSVITLSEGPDARSGSRAATSVLRTQVITNDGRRLGEVSDITLDEHGIVIAYQISQNVIRDTLHGRQQIATAQVYAVGEDAVLVHTVPEAQTPPEAGPAVQDETSPEAECAHQLPGADPARPEPDPSPHPQVEDAGPGVVPPAPSPDQRAPHDGGQA